MSLKTVHLIFVAAATLLAFGLGGAFLWHYHEEGGVESLGFGLGWGAAGVLLVVYGTRVLKKLRQLSYR